MRCLHSSIARSMPRPSFCTMQYILQFKCELGKQRCAGAGAGVVAHMISWAMAVRTERRGRRLRNKQMG